MIDLLVNVVSDAVGALFAPVWKFLQEMLGIAILCSGGGGFLTALSLMDFGFPMLLVLVVCAGLFLVGLVMAPGLHSNVSEGSFTERLARRRQLRKYVVEDV